MSRQSFYSALTRGKSVEQIVKAHLESRGHIIEDVSENVDYQKRDIDFIVKSANGQLTTLEVKMDKGISLYGNFFFEANSSTGDKGWLANSQARYICFFDSKTGYILDFDRIKKDLARIGREKTFFDKEDQKLRRAYLVSLDQAKSYVVHMWKEE